MITWNIIKIYYMKTDIIKCKDLFLFIYFLSKLITCIIGGLIYPMKLTRWLPIR